MDRREFFQSIALTTAIAMMLNPRIVRAKLLAAVNNIDAARRKLLSRIPNLFRDRIKSPVSQLNGSSVKNP